MTAEAFAAWRKKFEAEMREIDSKDKTKSEEHRKKLTGKQLFEQDANLYLQEGLEEGLCVYHSSTKTGLRCSRCSLSLSFNHNRGCGGGGGRVSL